MAKLPALKRAVAIAGGQARLARTLGLKSQGAVSNWFHKTGRVPAEQVLAIERATGVPRHELRPDLYPVER